MIIIIPEFPTHIARTDNKVAVNKMIKINNQSIYNGGLNRFARNIVMTNMHKYLRKQLKPYVKTWKREKVVFPISIDLTICTVVNHGSISMRSGKICWKYPKEGYEPNWDIENLATIWIKALNDTLTELGFIPDDNIVYIHKISYNFKDVEDLKDRALIILIDE